MDYDREIRQLLGESIALQMLFVHLAGQLADADPALREAVTRAFDHTASFLEDRTIEVGKAVPPEHLAHSIRVVEELRTAALGDEHKPKRGV